MAPQPLYDIRDQTPACQLRYTWCGWPSVAAFPALTVDAWQELTTAWETDGLRLLEREFHSDRVLLTFSALPNVSPVHLAARAKGRLQNSLRQSNATWSGFSRKVSVRSVGENTTEAVQHYVESQVSTADFVDPRFAEFLQQFTVSDEEVDLSIATESKRGRYWYNLHLVLVTDGRFRMVDEISLRMLRDGVFKIAAKKAYRVAAVSVMPDHLHVSLRGAVENSPEEIALAFQNNLAFMVNRGAIWRRGYYAGTFGEYNMNAIRVRQRTESDSPAGQARGGLTVDDSVASSP